MRTYFFVVFLFVTLLSLSYVNAVGQVILDEIRPIKDDKVTFEDPVFTNYGIITNINTNTFDITRQFELDVDVDDIFLTGLTGGASFSGSLGARISSEFGDLTFSAATDLDMVASEFNGVTRSDTFISSQAGDILLGSVYPLELISGAVNIFGEESLSFTSSGAIYFDAGRLFEIGSPGTITLSSERISSFEAEHGNLSIYAGDELVLSSNGVLKMDGTHGVSLTTQGELSMIGGRSSSILANTADILTKDNVTISYSQINFDGDDGVVFGGKHVILDAAGRVTIEGAFPGSVVSTDYGDFLHIEANNDITFQTTGETADIEVESKEFLVTADSYFMNSVINSNLGSNSTNAFQLHTSVFTFDADYMSIHSGDEIGVSSKSTTTFESDDMLIHSSSLNIIADGGLFSFSARDLQVLRTTGSNLLDTTLKSNSNFVANSDSLVLDTMRINGDFTGTQNYKVEDLVWTSTANQDISMGAKTDLDIVIEDDIDIVTSQFITSGGDSLRLFMSSYSLDATGTVDMIFTDIEIDTSENLSFESANDLHFRGEEASFVAGEETRFTVDGTATIDSDDLFVTAGDDIEIIADKTIHMDGSAETIITAGEFNINSENTYFKTSIFSAVAVDDVTVEANAFIGRFGELSLTADDDVTFTALTDVFILSGSHMEFDSDNSISFTTESDDIDIFVQETSTFSADGDIVINIEDDIDFIGSEEFIFRSDLAMTIIVGGDTSIFGEITEFSSLNGNHKISSFTSQNWVGGDVEMNSGNDVIFNSDDSLNIDTSPLTNEIVFNGRIFDIDALSDFDVESTDAITLMGSSLSADAVATNLNSVSEEIDISVNAFESTATITSTITGDNIDFISGFDDYFNSKSIGKITFTSEADFLTYVNTTTAFTAQTFIEVMSLDELFYSSIDATTISAFGQFAAEATNSIVLSAAEDMSFATQNSHTISITSVTDSVTVSLGRDFHLVSNGLDSSVTSCGAILFDTNDGNSAVFESEFGKLTADSFSDFVVTSSSLFTVTSAGNLFHESYNSGISYFAEGVANGITFETSQGESGNMEFMAIDSEIRMFAFSGFLLESGENMRLSSSYEFNITAKESSASAEDQTLYFSGDTEAYFSGARGLAFIAGLDAPEIDSDFTVDSDDIYVESQDRLHAQSIGTFTTTVRDNINIRNYEGSSIDVSAAASLMVMAESDIEFTTYDGDQTFTANNDNINGMIGNDISYTTRDGPLSMEALAGEFVLSGGDWEITSNMDNRALALGKMVFNAGSDLLVNSLSDDCVLIQNERGTDNVLFTGENIFADSNSLPNEYSHSDIQIIGNNIDFIITELTEFKNTENIHIGVHSSPIIRGIAGTDGTSGITFTDINTGDIETKSLNSIRITAGTNTTVTSKSTDILSNGFVFLTAIQDDINFINELGSIELHSKIISNSIGGLHTVTSDSLMFTQTVEDIDGRLNFNADDVVNALATTMMFSADILNDIDVDGDTTLSADSILFQNIVEDDTNTPLPFFSDIPNERAGIIFTVNDNIESTVLTDTSFEVGRSTTGIPLNNSPEIFIQSSGDHLLSTQDLAIQISELGGLLQFNSDDMTVNTQTTLSITTVATTPNEGVFTEPFDEHPADFILSADAITFKTEADFTHIGNSGTIFDVTDDITFNIVTDYSITVTETELTSFIEFTSGNEIAITGDIIDIVNQTPASGINNFEEEFEILFSSDSDIEFTSLTSIDIFHFDNFIVTGGSVDISAVNDFSTTTTSFEFLTKNFQSDIEVTSPLHSYSGNEFISSAYHAFVMDVTTQTVEADTFNVDAHFGDIFFEDNEAVFSTETEGISFIANGFENDRSGAFGVTTDGTLEFITEDITFEAKRKQEFFSEDIIQLTVVDFDLQSTGLSSDIVLRSFNSDIDFITPGPISISGGYASIFETTDLLNLESTATMDFTTHHSETGIIFTTNIVQNFDASISFFAETLISFQSNTFEIDTDFSRADDSPILLTADIFDITSTSVNSNLIFTAEEGAISISAGVSFTATVDDLDIFGDSVSLIYDTLELDITGNQYFESYYGEIRFRDTMSDFHMTAPTIFISSTSPARRNDITFSAEDTVTIGTGDPIFVIHGNGPNSAVLIENDFGDTSDVTFTMADDFDVESNSGIAIVGTRHSTPGTMPMSFIAGDNILIETYDKRGIVFFQSDHDTIIEASNTISHVNYETRMGFFSEVPDFIHLVNMQATEGCLRGGHCGMTNPVRGPNANVGISQIETVTRQLQNCLKDFGLINWVYPLV